MLGITTRVPEGREGGEGGSEGGVCSVREVRVTDASGRCIIIPRRAELMCGFHF